MKISNRFRIIGTIVIIALSALNSFNVNSKEKTFGIGGGYINRNHSGIAGLNFTYKFTEHFRLAPSVNYAFRHHGRDAFMLAADGQFPFELTSTGNFSIFPLAGISYWTWNVKNLPSDLYDIDVEFDDVTTRHSRFALDMGAGCQWKASPTLALSFVITYAIMHHTPALLVSGGIAYIF